MSSFQPYNPDQGAREGSLDPPADGTHTGCRLHDASAFTSKAGNDFVKFEWETSDHYRWTVLQGFKSDEQAAVTWSEVSKLGINPTEIASLEQLNQAITAHINGYYDLAVKTNGNFRNTYINGATTQTQASLPTNGQEPAAVGAPSTSEPAEDDIPF
jgi:hypothetical protein